MTVEYLSKMDRIAKKAGTRRPDGVLTAMNCIFIDPGQNMSGFVCRRKGFTYYGVNQNITGKKYDFCIMHEGFHILCGHLDMPGFLNGEAPIHIDNQRSFATYKLVAGTERDANIGAADFIIDTEVILDMLGYDNTDVAAYRTSVESFDQAVQDYQRHLEIVLSNGSPESRISRMLEYQRRLTAMYDELQEQARDICNSGICFTKEAIAREFGVPEYIIEYKFEALRLRNYNVSMVEAPRFDKVFSSWK